MRSRGISRKSNMRHCQFSILLKSSLGEVHFAETPPDSNQWFQSHSNGKILKTIEKRKVWYDIPSYNFNRYFCTYS